MTGQFGFLKDWKLALLVGRAKEASGVGRRAPREPHSLWGGFPIHCSHLIVPLAVLKAEVAKPCLLVPPP